MGNGGFFCRKKVTPQPFPIVATTETTVPKIAPKEKPYGYFKLFPGKTFSIFDYYILFFESINRC
jgi:hypothetical protein